MVTVGGQPGHSVLDAALDVFRMRHTLTSLINTATLLAPASGNPSDRSPFGRDL
jgi:hypothetical protein